VELEIRFLNLYDKESGNTFNLGNPVASLLSLLGHNISGFSVRYYGMELGSVTLKINNQHTLLLFQWSDGSNFYLRYVNGIQNSSFNRGFPLMYSSITLGVELVAKIRPQWSEI
jgi:hypothetical protein